MAGRKSALKYSKAIFTQTPEQIRDEIIEKGYGATEATAYIIGNKTQALQYVVEGAETLSKGTISLHSGRKVGESAFKTVSDASRGDYVCAGFCTAAGCLECIAGVYIWIPGAPYKGQIVTGLKAGSQGLLKFRDMCASAGPNSFC